MAYIVESLDKWVPWSLQTSQANVDTTCCSPHTNGKTPQLKTKLTYVMKQGSSAGLTTGLTELFCSVTLLEKIDFPFASEYQL